MALLFKIWGSVLTTHDLLPNSGLVAWLNFGSLFHNLHECPSVLFVMACFVGTSRLYVIKQ